MPAPPVRIGPYELGPRLGIGGMAETYLAVRRGPGGFEQRVCLKRVRRDLERDPEFVRQFLAEAAIAAKLRHTAIAQVLDFGCEHDDYYMALELVEGLDLRALLEAVGRGLPPEIVLHIATELASALDFAHRAGGDDAAAPVVHRDVSTSNALLSFEGEVKLADFGIARSMSGPQHTQTGVVKGKVPYLAPEYARSGRFDVRCDLFSLGVVLYETACGERPHDGATDLETLERAMQGMRRPLAERAPALPAALADIIEQLLEHDPALRFQSAAALLEALIDLPVSGRARRDLGTLVTSVRREQGMNASRSVAGAPLPRTVAMPDADADAGRAEQPAIERTRAQDTANPASFGTSGMPYRTLRRGPRIAIAVALVFATAAIGLWLTQRVGTSRAVDSRAVQTATATASNAPATTAPAPSATPSASLSANEIIQRPVATTASEAPTTLPSEPIDAPAEQRSQRAQLQVIVLPYGGEVFVDGKRIGVAPITFGLAAGEHNVRSGTLKRRVTLNAGERRQLVLR